MKTQATVLSTNQLAKTKPQWKETLFMWSWNNYEPRLDEAMTRSRAASLLWAWRRTSRKPTSMRRMIRSFRRVSKGVYRVVDLQSNETGTMYISRPA